MSVFQQNLGMLTVEYKDVTPPSDGSHLVDLNSNDCLFFFFFLINSNDCLLIRSVRPIFKFFFGTVHKLLLFYK